MICKLWRMIIRCGSGLCECEVVLPPGFRNIYDMMIRLSCWGWGLLFVGLRNGRDADVPIPSRDGQHHDGKALCWTLGATQMTVVLRHLAKPRTHRVEIVENLVHDSIRSAVQLRDCMEKSILQGGG